MKKIYSAILAASILLVIYLGMSSDQNDSQFLSTNGYHNSREKHDRLQRIIEDGEYLQFLNRAVKHKQGDNDYDGEEFQVEQQYDINFLNRSKMNSHHRQDKEQIDEVPLTKFNRVYRNKPHFRRQDGEIRHESQYMKNQHKINQRKFFRRKRGSDSIEDKMPHKKIDQSYDRRVYYHNFQNKNTKSKEHALIGQQIITPLMEILQRLQN